MNNSYFYYVVVRTEIYTFFWLFAICLILFCITKLNSIIKIKQLPYITGAIALATASAYVAWYESMGTPLIFNFIMAAIVVGTIFVLGMMPFTFAEYALLYSVILIIVTKSFNERLSYLSILLFSVLSILVRSRGILVRNRIFHIWASVLFAGINFTIFNAIKKNYFTIGYYSLQPIGKLIVWWLAGTIYLGISIVIVHILKKKFADFFEEMQKLSTSSMILGSEFMVFSIGILFLTHFLGMWMNYSFISLDVSGLTGTFIIYGFDITILIIQIAYLLMLLKLGRAKIQQLDFQREKQTLLLYNSSLEKNMKEIRNIKHDIKNIFFTMGEYVNRSDDKDMKNFFKEKITPFADEEIQKNDIYMKLLEIPDEEFRAFLFYKINQGMAHGVSIRLQVNFEKEEGIIRTINFTDLVRVLGIFLDNSVEEVAQQDCGYVQIRLLRNGKEESFTIENTVRSTVKESGVAPGTTTKGLGRGNGLSIVENVLEKYDHILLNTYFQENRFIQNLTIYKTPK